MGYLQDTAEGLLYTPDNRLYWQPSHFGLDYDKLTFFGEKGSITAWHLHALSGTGRRNEVRPIILFCHCGSQNMSQQITQCGWLAQKGYEVVIFDYRGCGWSVGNMTLKGIREDGLTLAVGVRETFPDKRFVVIGQGAGAEAAICASAVLHERVEKLILESAYLSLEEWFMKRYGPGIGHLLRIMAGRRAEEPQDLLSKLRLPLLVINPIKDELIPKAQKEAWRTLSSSRPRTMLYEPNKAFLNVMTAPESQDRILDFIRLNVPL